MDILYLFQADEKYANDMQIEHLTTFSGFTEAETNQTNKQTAGFV